MRAWCACAALLAACGGDPEPAASPSPAPDSVAPDSVEVSCPTGQVVPEREARLRALLAETEAAPLLAGAAGAEVVWCFGATRPAVVMADRWLLLDAADDDAAVAARVGHLMHHVVHGSPLALVEGADDCDAAVDRALRREASAYALELRLRWALDAPPSPFEFEPTYRTDRDESAIHRYLATHPEGAPGLDALAQGYRAVCER